MNKTIGIHQPNFLPWSGYFHKITSSDVFVFLDNVDIETKSAKAITNRSKIKTGSGEQWLTIPLKKGESKLISVQEYVDANWRDKTLKSIFLNYKKAPFFSEIYPLIEKIMLFPTNNLSEFNINSILQICEHLNIINKSFLRASEMELESEDRNERIIEICGKAGCDTYFSGRGGKNYHDESLFTAKGINIEYTKHEQIPYTQLYGEFIPGLSIIDSLFNKNEI